MQNAIHIIVSVVMYVMPYSAVALPVDSSTPSPHTPWVAEIGRLKEEVGTLLSFTQ